jgi:gamma-glutamylcyclotransferase (GGCT)/AIG2-like uncharacterized protein YtfP
MSTNYPILYGAYGANTNMRHMAQRCPTARYVGNMIVDDMALIFRGVADVIPHKGSRVWCALWRIMPSDERALDQFEGYPTHYTKIVVDLVHKGKSKDVMLYVMAGNRRDRHEPPQSYEQTLREGYIACNMPQRQIDEAVREAQESTRRELRYKGKWWKQDNIPAHEWSDAADDKFNDDASWAYNTLVRP